MIKQSKSRGFTIVELLIVIVIIAILAAITIVAYNGITARAHASAAQQAAQNVSNKAEAYNAENGVYPSTFAQMSSAASNTSYYLPSSAYTLATAKMTAAPANDNAVNMQLCSSGAGVVGNIIGYWNFSTNAIGTITAGATGGTGVTCAATYVAS